MTVEPVVKESPLAEVLATLEPIEEGFPTIDDPPVGRNGRKKP